MTQAQIFNGAWEDIASHAEQFKDRRNLTLIVPMQEPTESREPAPEPRKFRDVLEFLDSLPPSTLTAEDWERIEREIQEEKLVGIMVMPSAGDVYVDTQTVIYTVQQNPIYAPVCHPLWQAMRAGSIAVVSSDLTLMETLIMPLRNADANLIQLFEYFLLQAHVGLLPITQDVLREAARLRALIVGLKTPDAIHAATALLHGCTLFVTNDMGFKRIPNLPVVTLADVLAAP